MAERKVVAWEATRILAGKNEKKQNNRSMTKVKSIFNLNIVFFQ